MRSLLFPSLNSAFLRGSQTTNRPTWGFRRSCNQAAEVPSSKVSDRVPLQSSDALHNRGGLGLQQAFPVEPLEQIVNTITYFATSPHDISVPDGLDGMAHEYGNQSPVCNRKAATERGGKQQAKSSWTRKKPPGKEVRQCLICEGVFTRRAASEHSIVLACLELHETWNE